MIRKIDPSDPNQLVTPEKRDFRINEPPRERVKGRFVSRIPQHPPAPLKGGIPEVSKI